LLTLPLRVIEIWSLIEEFADLLRLVSGLRALRTRSGQCFPILDKSAFDGIIRITTVGSEADAIPAAFAPDPHSSPACGCFNVLVLRGMVKAGKRESRGVNQLKPIPGSRLHLFHIAVKESSSWNVQFHNIFLNLIRPGLSHTQHILH
jgi:hypothetical protein